MKVSEQDVRYVAELAHLELTAEECTRMQRDLDAILGYIDRLKEIDTSNIEAMTQVSVATLQPLDSDSASEKAQNPALRMDELRPSLDRQTVMSNAPATDGSFFKVPKVIER